MAQVCSQRWAAQPDAAQRTAIIEHHTGGAHRSYSFAQLQKAADDLSLRLQAMGVQKGDRVAIVLPLTFIVPPSSAIILLAAIYYGAMYGGAVSSILLGIPGASTAVATTFDGRP
ncbi:MAG: hypothetical protein EBW37_13220, partial [Rhodobacteraceae bacterium]|nr:hypothetical protein [Paracoccaceae bacterium]